MEYGQKCAQKPRHPFIPVIGPVSPSPDARLFPRRAVFITTYSLYLLKCAVGTHNAQFLSLQKAIRMIQYTTTGGKSIHIFLSRPGTVFGSPENPTDFQTVSIEFY